MRILVLHQHYWPEIAATAQILSDLCEDLATAGHEVTVVCGQPSYRRVDGMADRLARDEVHRGVRIVRVPAYAPSSRTIPRRLAHYATFFASSLVASLVSRKPDAVFVLSTPPLLLGLSGQLLTALRGVPFVYSVQDLYPDVAVDLGVLRPGAFTDAIDRMARWQYASARSVVTLSDAMAERLVAKGVARERITVIPNWSDTDQVTPRARDNEFARAHGLADPGVFVVQYSGNVGLSQGLEHLPAAAELVRDLPVQFAVVGDGNARAALESDVARRGLSNVRFIAPQPRERLADLLGSCDAGLVPLRRGVGADLVPSKLYGVMAAARPVLAAVDEDTEVTRTVRRHACGVVVEPESPGALAGAVRGLFAGRDEARAMGERGRVACVENYGRRACTGRYERVLREG